MANQELLAWIRQQSERGASKEQIKSALLQNGWQENAIEEAFVFLERPQDGLSGASSPAQGVVTLEKLPSVFVLLGQAFTLFAKRFSTFMGILTVLALVYIALVVGMWGISKIFELQSAVWVPIIVVMFGVGVWRACICYGRRGFI